MNRSAVALAAVGCCGILAATPGQAQRAANLSSRDIPAEQKARDTMNRFAICIVKARPNLTKRALAAPTFAEKDKALRELVKKECLGDGTIVMAPGMFEGALYRALYLEEFADLYPEPDALAAGAAIASDNPMQVFGDCVVRKAPRDAHAFLTADPATPEERSALAGLRPALQECVPEDQEIQFSLGGLQATLAKGVYDRAVASARPAGAN